VPACESRALGVGITPLCARAAAAPAWAGPSVQASGGPQAYHTVQKPFHKVRQQPSQ